MGKAQSRLAILIIAMTTINAIILSSLLTGPGIIFTSMITFCFVLVSEYLLTKQTIESSKSKLMVFNQLGVQTRSVISIIISRFIIVGLIGLFSGIIIGASVVYTLHLPLNVIPNILQNSILYISILTIIGICIGSYAAIIQSFKQSNLYQ